MLCLFPLIYFLTHTYYIVSFSFSLLLFPFPIFSIILIKLPYLYSRGVGGMFFDDLPATYKTMNFVQDVTKNWMSSWFPIIQKRQSLTYTDQQKEWQLLRRGRYLEFNLLYDRGVKFGLSNLNPRVEGVMVSAPPLIAWEYNHLIEPNSEEERLMKILKSPIEWV